MDLAPENITPEQLFEENQKLKAENLQLEARINEMQFRIDQMNRLLFGAKRERFIKDADENQLILPFDVGSNWRASS